LLIFLIPLSFQNAIVALRHYENELDSNRPAHYPSLLPATVGEQSAPPNTLVQLAYTASGLFVPIVQED
jgi:hypothetical protein